MAAMYIYAPGSPFESIVNEYMSLGIPIVPPMAKSEIISLLSSYSSTSTYQNATMISMSSMVSSTPQDVKLLDLVG